MNTHNAGLFCILPVIVLISIFLSSCKPEQYSSESKIVMTMQSWAGEDNSTFQAAEEFSELVSRATGGQLKIVVYPSGSKIPEKNEFEAVISGQVDMVQIPPGWTSDYLAAADFFSNWVNGLTPNQLEMWMKIEGRSLAQELYGAFAVHFVGILTLSPPEVWAHSTKPLRSVDDLKNLSIRLGGGDTISIFKKMGASPVLLPGSEIYESVKDGDIEAFEYINPSVNLEMKFYEVAKYMYLDPSRSPCDTQVLLINHDSWEKLPESFQEIVSMACDKIAREYYTEAVKLDLEAIEEFKKQGTVVADLPDDIRSLLDEKSLEFFNEELRKDDDFKMLYEKSLQWKNICDRLGIR